MREEWLKELEVSNQEKKRQGKQKSFLQTFHTVAGRESKVDFLQPHKREPIPGGSSRERNFSSTEGRTSYLQQIREKEPD